MKSKIKVLADFMPGESSLPDSKMSIFSLCPYMVEGDKGALWGSFYRGLIQSSRAPLLGPGHLPNIPPPKTIALEGGFQCTDFGGTQTSVAGSQSSVSQLEFYHRWITTQEAPFLAWQAALRYLNYSQSPRRTLQVIRWLLYNVSLFPTRK